jgi:carboxyl-terminal processing protease
MYWDGKPGFVTPPVGLGLVEDKIVVTHHSTDLNTHFGDMVLEVDGVDARKLFEKGLSNAFGATKYARTVSACRAMIEGEEASEVTFKLSNPQKGEYEIVLTRTRHGSTRREPVLSSRCINDDVGYIKISSWGGFSPQEFDKVLEEMRDRPYLIIDVRNNGGGSDELAEQVVGRFIAHKIVCSISFQRQAGTDMYKKTVAMAEPRGPWRYQGKVAVLINEGCASACEHFVSGMFEAGALLVGTPTSGACGWSKLIELPVGVRLSCSLTFPLHGKIPSPLNGMQPHHLVLPTIDNVRQGRDTVLEKAVSLLNQPEKVE